MSSISLLRKLRFLLLTIPGFGIGGIFFIDAWQAIQAGIFTLTARRGVVIFIATQAESPISFFLAVAAFITLGILFFAVTVWQISALLRPVGPETNRVIETIISSVERKAPSGLRPLWLGLLVAAVCFALYAAA